MIDIASQVLQTLFLTLPLGALVVLAAWRGKARPLDRKPVPIRVRHEYDPRERDSR